MPIENTHQSNYPIGYIYPVQTPPLITVLLDWNRIKAWSDRYIFPHFHDSSKKMLKIFLSDQFFTL